ncbi:MAG: molybdopterin-dependent oxidoreductase [Candidatus Nitronauta litoralis]|uniref:Molybdopterin-dependent oxidoreductase n=1 Tax=Candidatus Nitronauta litoralis TaxID=2705533 RepID=A0A7T0BWK4_9BACT|nr:MAG: molybdopterin-dependent oxidoreductase [Candidatus Nitronauta litoralis]
MTRARFLQIIAGWAFLFAALPFRALAALKLKPVANMAPRFTVPTGDTSPITPTSRFYVEDISGVPDYVKAGAPDWMLQIHGEVERPLSLNLKAIAAKPQVQKIITLSCIGNPVGGHAIGNAKWQGISLRKLLEEVSPSSDADWMIVRGADGYHESIPIKKARHPAALLATHMNGERLTKDHGYPLRLLIPGLYGIKQVKWIQELEFSAGRQPGYWNKKGWTRDARVQIFSRIDWPHQGENLLRGNHNIRGVAFAGDRGIIRVEISFDEGKTWQLATLGKPLSNYSWVFWNASVPLGPGHYSVMVRAADLYSGIQSGYKRDPFPAGVNGFHRIEFKVF